MRRCELATTHRWLILFLVRRMKPFVAFLASTLLLQTSLAGYPPSPESQYHLLLGPYEYDRDGRHLPRYFTLDGKQYTSIVALEAAVAALPAGSTVYLRGSCEPVTVIDLPPYPVSLLQLRTWCSSRRISFTWTSDAGGD